MVMGPAIEALHAVEPAAVPALKLAAIEAHREAAARVLG
jgi:hypothetical protein